MISKEIVAKEFKELYSAPAENFYFAPGRVNLMGEHIDYLGGHVLPCAISMGITVGVRTRTDNLLRFYSKNFDADGIIEVKLEKCCEFELKKQDKYKWTNYVLGVIYALAKNGFKLTKGLDIYYSADLPNTGGLSSSAAVQVVSAFMFRDLFGFDFDDIKLCQLVQQSENEFIGVRSGILDQFAVTMGKANHAIYLDTQTLNYELVPINLTMYKLVVIDSNKPRTLQKSGYNDRRMQCDMALYQLNKYTDKKYLCDFTLDEFIEVSNHITEPVLFNRAFHAVTENQRTIYSAKALKENHLPTFADFMFCSHRSLKHRYEVTVPETDAIIEFCKNFVGVIGARMTGAGFGGCCIAIVHNEKVYSFVEELEKFYEDKTGLKCSCYVTDIVDGVRKI